MITLTGVLIKKINAVSVINILLYVLHVNDNNYQIIFAETG